MAEPFRVLIVEDEHLYAQALVDELERWRIPVEVAGNCAEALRLAESRPDHYRAVLLDHRLPDRQGLQIIPRLRALQSEAVVIMMTAYHTIPDAVQAIRLGAEDYIVKETSLEPIVDRVLEVRRHRQARANDSGWHEHNREGLLGRSPGMRRVFEQLDKVRRAPDTTVLLTGETGVGKEVAARSLHAMSRPAGSPFVAIDCVALPSNLAESLLFGHEKGAFTGADQTRAGALAEAADGSLLLDEIGDMDQQLQGKLLRVLECRSFSRVGSVREQPLRARVIAATNRDLGQLVEQGRFRHDLYQRLCVFPIRIPALRERGDDVLLLAEHFRAFFAERMGKQIAPPGIEVRAQLLSYGFPGNVRELKNIIERAVIMADGERVECQHLPRRVLAADEGPRGQPDTVPVDFRPGVDTLESLEKRMIRHALEQAGHVKTEAARLLGISRFQLLRRMERHGLKESDPKRTAKPATKK